MMLRFLFAAVVVLVLGIVFTQQNNIREKLLERQYANSPAKNELQGDSYLRRIMMSSGEAEANETKGVWFNKTVTVPRNLAERISEPPEKTVLGQTAEEKWIEVDLSNQTLYAHQGNRIVYTFLVSSGLPWFPTVTGEFHIWAKLLSQRMAGGSVQDGTYYDLPNVPFVEYFYRGYGLHGTYWHNNFGHPMSHGCVNLSTADAQTLFNWTDPPLSSDQTALFNIDPTVGTRVVVHGTTPLPTTGG